MKLPLTTKGVYTISNLIAIGFCSGYVNVVILKVEK